MNCDQAKEVGPAIMDKMVGQEIKSSHSNALLKFGWGEILGGGRFSCSVVMSVIYPVAACACCAVLCLYMCMIYCILH